MRRSSHDTFATIPRRRSASRYSWMRLHHPSLAVSRVLGRGTRRTNRDHGGIVASSEGLTRQDRGSGLSTTREATDGVGQHLSPTGKEGYSGWDTPSSDAGFGSGMKGGSFIRIVGYGQPRSSPCLLSCDHDRAACCNSHQASKGGSAIEWARGRHGRMSSASTPFPREAPFTRTAWAGARSYRG